LGTLEQMAHNPVRKFTIFALIYSITIFGIFMLQFRNESSLFKMLGTMHLQLFYAKPEKNTHGSKSGSEEKTPPLLQNAFRVSGRGLILYAGKSAPLILRTADKKDIPLVLQSWKETGKSAFTLFFSEQVSLSFDYASERLNISAVLPSTAVSLRIPYKTTKTYRVTNINHSRNLIKSKSETRILQAPSLADGFILLQPSAHKAVFALYERTGTFSFASITNSVNAREQTVYALSEQARSEIRSRFTDVQEENISENLAAAYVAENAIHGMYRAALAAVPASFKDSAKRTYISAPYFGSTVKMYQSVVTENERINARIRESLEKKNLAVFGQDALPFVLLQKSVRENEAVLSLPASSENLIPNAAEAAGILNLYTVLNSAQPESAERLAPALQRCVSVLENACVLSDSKNLHLAEDGIRIDEVLTAKAARALQKYGRLTGHSGAEAAGNLLLTSILQKASEMDVLTLADIYPYIAGTNNFYPHIEVLGFEKGTPVWAWTAASNIGYTKESGGTVTLRTSFTQGETHYAIINGIDPFAAAEVHGRRHPSDSRFEAIDSSGYSYSAQTKTLFFKYLHTSPEEIVRLFKYIPVQAKPENTAEDKPENAVVEEAHTPNGTAAPKTAANEDDDE